jgi:predicted GNAT family acetyltransferase
MTELLYPVRTESSTTTALDAPGTVIPLAEVSIGRQASELRATRHARDIALLDDDLSSEDLTALSTRQLRVMVNQVYKLMDTDYPPAGATDRYEMLVEELEHRAQQAAERGNGSVHPMHQLKETFRDNPLYCRFELFVDGTLGAYVKYTMNGAQIILTDGVEQPAFRDQGLDATLMRHVMLNAHKRRLGLVPQCPMAFSFLADHPQYQVLTAQPGC